MLSLHRCPGCACQVEVATRLLPGFPGNSKIICPLCSAFVATVRNDVGEPTVRVLGVPAQPPPARRRGLRRLFN